MEVRRRSTPTKKREAATSSSVASATDLRDPNDPSAWPDDISLDYFYRPHTITILLLAVSALVFSAFYRYITGGLFVNACLFSKVLALCNMMCRHV